MGIDQLKKEIIDNAKKQAQAIVSNTKKEASEIVKNAEKDAKEASAAAEEETRKMIEALKAKEMSAARFDTRKAVFDKKQELIDNVFDKVKEKLDKMPAKEREKIATKLLEKALKELDVHYVYGNSKDRKTIEAKYKFEEKPILGGIIAETEDKKISIDYSYEQILDEIKSSTMQDIAKRLF